MVVWIFQEGHLEGLLGFESVIRGVLLPATMKLLGDKNWYLPSWLGWLPRLRHRPEPRAARA